MQCRNGKICIFGTLTTCPKLIGFFDAFPSKSRLLRGQKQSSILKIRILLWHLSPKKSIFFTSSLLEVTFFLPFFDSNYQAWERIYKTIKQRNKNLIKNIRPIGRKQSCVSPLLLVQIKLFNKKTMIFLVKFLFRCFLVFWILEAKTFKIDWDVTFSILCEVNYVHTYRRCLEKGSYDIGSAVCSREIDR